MLVTDLQKRIQKTSKTVYWLMRWLCLYPAVRVAQQLVWLINLLRHVEGFSDAFSAAGLTLSQEIGLRLCTAVIYLLLSLVVVQVQKIFFDIGYEYTPFQPIHVKRLRRGALYSLLYSLGYYGINEWAFQMKALAQRPVIAAGYFLLPVLIYCFSLILDYGCQLQRQADETL